MKKALFPFLALFAGVGFAGTNLVVNSDFEQFDARKRPVGWTNLPSNFRVERSAGENGSCGLVYENGDPASYQLPGQDVKLEKGREYRFSARVRTEGLKRNGGPGGANVCIEFADAEGQFAGGGYATPVLDTKGQWRTLECKSVRVPEKAVSAQVKPYVDRGLTGKAYFDSIRIEPVERKPVSGLWCSAYQSLVAEGEVTFAAGLELPAAGLRTEDCRAVFRYVRADGTKAIVEAQEYSADVARIRIPVADLPLGRSVIGFQLKAKATGGEIPDSRFTSLVTRVAKLPERKVRFDAMNRTIVDGKPFLPIGVYANGRLAEEDLLRLEKSPVNCIQNYTEPKRDEADAYAAHGLRFFGKLADAYVGRGFQTEAAAEAFVRKHVAELKDHPALLGWYLFDELGLDFVDQMRARRNLLQELDPDHPTYAVIYQIAHMRHYMGTCDVMGTDPYPISSGTEIGQAGDWARRTHEGLFGMRPVWQVPQAFDWGAYWKGKDDQTRMPTRDEMANMGWQAIAGGANGLVYFSYFDMKRMDRKTPFEKAWRDFTDAVSEIARFERTILSDGEPPKATCANEKVLIRAWGGDEPAVLAVNATTEPQQAEIALGFAIRAVRTELGPDAKAVGSGLAVTLPPLATGIWRLSR